MMDKALPYHSMYFRRDAGAPVSAAPLARGYSLRLYRPGGREHWAAIETDAGEFPSHKAAAEKFDEEFAPHPHEAERRMLFATGPDGAPAGTCTAWWKEQEGGVFPLLHFLAVREEHQGRSLGSALAAAVMLRFEEISPGQPVFLSTQTWSWPAICIYLRLGFRLRRCEGWQAAVDCLAGRMPDDMHAMLTAGITD